jgi:hypothetical protein
VIFSRRHKEFVEIQVFEIIGAEFSHLKILRSVGVIGIT